MRIAFALAALCVLAPSAAAQLLAVVFDNPKDAAKFKAHLVTFEGRQVVVGEPFKYVTIDFEKDTISRTPHVMLEFFVADPGDPSKVPYEIEGDVRVVTKAKQLVSIPEGGSVDRCGNESRAV